MIPSEDDDGPADIEEVDRSHVDYPGVHLVATGLGYGLLIAAAVAIVADNSSLLDPSAAGLAGLADLASWWPALAIGGVVAFAIVAVLERRAVEDARERRP